MTLSENNIFKLIKNLFSLFLIYIGLQILASLISMTFIGILGLLLKQNLLSKSSNSLNFLVFDCIFQIMAIYFFSKTYKNKEFNIIKINNHISLKTIGKYSLISLGIGGISTLWILLANFLSNYLPFIKNSLEDFSNLVSVFDGYPFLTIISVVILAPIFEELVFRGIIFNEASKYKGGAFPIIISALLFGLAHMQPIQIVYAFIVGLIFGFVYSKTHSLPIVMFLHMLNNLLTLFPEPFSTFISIIQILSIIPMIYLLRKLYKESKV
ncbi:CPBP family intramembrane metalloprotease [Clostridium perfringens]|uniref:CPBP family intramembrane glutamic endopeptidase n=1 Tax=Clostridium perfringens TaxID=1502 RepID=UPI000A5E8C74|nr:CPBP family intramembrane glutamic endopeptidase [Clostridium perfringens]MDU2655010.1 CPBP family intramembrane glutamic endopeptidase [Clostridium perfringens]MDU7782492.1 CPBP family intramembrane glutamic endopeptidase [Clostridium perfringens]MDU7897585.1 CPBP family intramembrane glutamic endopeptidase [Clostridium perfringens]MDZ5045915.1 CPBP family intramembrane metalloprotease [Clostridium perfringens]MDZ5051542.1 CPBP family intramembrane metalloprotease [Clostridium perfringens]